MKRTVREILAECKGGREVMSLRDFTLCIKTIHAHLNLACFSPDGSRESKRHLKMADDICLAVEDCFADQNSNLVNWFRREPCEFHHPLTGNDVKVEVRDDIEAIYYFLHYCMIGSFFPPLQTGSRTIWIPCRENFAQRKMGAFCPHSRTVTPYLCKSSCFPI